LVFGGGIIHLTQRNEVENRSPKNEEVMGMRARNIKRRKAANYGSAQLYKEREPGKGISSIDLRILAVENGRLMEQQSVLKKRRVINE
jgi:hypothetical protein